MTQTRIDKWLWAARFYKTRSLAAQAVNAGHIHLNDERVKAAKAVKVGDMIRVRKDSFEVCAYIENISEKRGSATIAATLYSETANSIAKREAMRLQLKALRQQAPEHRPNKRERRQLIAIKSSQNK